MHHVILGAGPAGVIAAETLRKVDKDAGVTLIGGESEPPYGRLAIPYVLTGKIGEDGTYLRKTTGHFESLRIDYLQGRATAVSPSGGKLTLEGGETLTFDRLLVATGSRPIRPPIDGLEGEGVHHCWTLEDARNIARLAADGADVVLIGAGFIGCIIMEALASRGVKLAVVETEDRLAPRMMNKAAGDMLSRWCSDKGVNVLTSAKVTGVSRAGTEKNAKMTVELEGGDALPADLIVVAAGVRANADFLAGSGVEVAAGVKVDHFLRTSEENIFAAGDVAEGPDFSGGWSVQAIQPTAVDHGRIAALNMAGLEARFQGGLNMNVLDTLGLISCSFGDWAGVDGGNGVEQLDEKNFKYLRLEFLDDCLVGALGIGRTDRIGCLRGLIQSRIALGAWKEKLLADPGRFNEAYVAVTRP